jgi:hypothetical protein
VGRTCGAECDALLLQNYPGGPSMNRNWIFLPLLIVCICVLSGCDLQLKITSPAEGAVLPSGQILYYAYFSLSGNNRDPTFTCQVDNSAPESCRSGWEFNLLADGPHTLSVTAQVDGKTVSQVSHFSIAPVPLAVSPPDGSVINSLDIAPTVLINTDLYHITPGLYQLQCRMDSGPVEQCQTFRGYRAPYAGFSGPTYHLTEGQHTFWAALLDESGNTLASDTSTFTVELEPTL